jgi:hypothetical protein
MLAVNDLASHVGMEAACRAFAFSPGYVYRDRARRRGVFSRHPIAVRPRPPLAFSIAEQEYLLGVERRSEGARYLWYPGKSPFRDCARSRALGAALGNQLIDGSRSLISSSVSDERPAAVTLL